MTFLSVALIRSEYKQKLELVRKPHAVPNELASSVSLPEEAFFNYFRALSRPRVARGAHWKGRGRPKYAQLDPNIVKWTSRVAKRAPRVRSAGSKYSQMDAQRGETGVPTTIEAQKQENVKTRAPSRRELDFRGVRGVPNKLFREFSRF